MSDREDPKAKEESTGFKVSDRRQFTADGSPVEQDASKTEQSPDDPQQQAQQSTRNDQSTQKEEAKSIDFSSFVLSLATTAMAHLGEVPDPTTGQASENLEAAHQMIDILSLLEQKTKGNLEADEERLLEGLLYELRIKYLDKTKKITL